MSLVAPNPIHSMTGQSAECVPNAAREVPHISVCVCTYKRPHSLKRLLTELMRQHTANLFTYSIVIADNDIERTAEHVVQQMSSFASVPLGYFVEPIRSIALARNKVLEHAAGDYIALIDDDEIPSHDWLLSLFNDCSRSNADGVLGPVVRHFDEQPPAWFKKSRIYYRRVNPTGKPVVWKEARTGNVLLKKQVFAGDAKPFRPEFRAGEDQDFFRRKIESGYTFVWTANAAVCEVIPPARWKRSYILRKAMLQGATAALFPNCGAWNVSKSLVAVPLYLLILPFSLLLGQQHFMSLAIKICDHAGKLLMLMGIDLIREEYVSE